MSNHVTPTMPYEEPEQDAIVAWCLVDQDFFEKVRQGIKQKDIRDILSARIYKGLCDFWHQFHRLPTVEELSRESIFMHAEDGLRERMVAKLKELPESRKKFGKDVLEKDIERWMKVKIFIETANGFSQLYSQSIRDQTKLDKALETISDGLVRIQATTFEDGNAGKIYDMEEDYQGEIPDRKNEINVPYGIPFLDDALGGIGKKDLVLVGARTGQGKTELVTHIASHVAKSGIPVHMFALEAEKHEVVRRIKFTLLSQAYYSDPRKPNLGDKIRYGAWRRNQLLELDKYEPRVLQQIQKDYKNLHVKYREDGVFDNERLEKEIKAVANHSGLIIIDHVHYIDIDGENENLAYKRVIKTARDLTLRHGVPIIMVAHIRKAQSFKKIPLVPSNDDFMGTSDLTKVCTTAILLGRGVRNQSTPSYIRPTLFRITKSRVEGDLSWMVATCDFDIRQKRYTDGYELGRLTDEDTNYEPWPYADRSKNGFYPYWAKHVWGAVDDRGVEIKRDEMETKNDIFNKKF